MGKRLNPNFIGEYDYALTKVECDKLIEYFEQSDQKKDGAIVRHTDGEITINRDIKDSTDLPLSFSDNTFPSFIIGKPLVKCTKMYREEYPCCDGISKWNIADTYNIQRYYPNQGYHQVHCESGAMNSPRVLAWMIYLNTLTDGGETCFPTYNLKIKPRNGKLLIWPAFFTHMHHGLISKTQTKYIVTGWHNYT